MRGDEGSEAPIEDSGFPDRWSWDTAGALDHVTQAQERLGRHLSGLGASVQLDLPAARWLLHGPVLRELDHGLVGGVLDDALDALDAGSAPRLVVDVVDNLAALGARQDALERAEDISLVQMTEVVRAHEAVCHTRPWHWAVNRRGWLAIEAIWTPAAGPRPAWWDEQVTRLVVDPGGPVRRGEGIYGTAYATPRLLAGVLAQVECWLVAQANDSARAQSS